MTTLYFKVSLLTDIILNQKAASEGPNTTLDFIPGSNFLGIAASVLYKGEDARTMDLFHNGKVRFGDAHLASATESRSLKVPAVMFYPKLSTPDKELYIQYLTPKESARELQLKQCRSGFYDFTAEDQKAMPMKAETNFAIKSAHDRENRTSLKNKMFGYESLQAGAQLYFSVELDDPALEKDLENALTGDTKRIGRSRSAQYGLVKIERYKFNEVASRKKTGDFVTVYADARLIFIDAETGLPTFTPTPEQLGVTGGHIAWDKSQIRTFQYTPWNFKRQCFDTDRCGIEKGSVFVIEKCSSCPEQSQYIGSYQNEGFGRVIYNPSFLEGNEATGEALWSLLVVDKKKNDSLKSMTPKSLAFSDDDSPLLAKLKEENNENLKEISIFNAVNNWKAAHSSSFASKKFASQWGTIRSIATRRLLEGSENSRFTSIMDELFLSTDMKEKNGYLCHGIAAPNWEDHGRRKSLEDFVSMFQTEDDKCLAVINLAAEMAKIYR